VASTDKMSRNEMLRLVDRTEEKADFSNIRTTTPEIMADPKGTRTGLPTKT